MIPGLKISKKVKIIPLGQNCMPRTVLTRQKVKPPKILGELTYPFDLAVFGMTEITKILQNDFKEFFSNLEFNGKIWIKKNTQDINNNCIEFHHEKGLNDRNKLIEIYKKRIENFRYILKDETPVIFFQITPDISEIENQYKELLRLREERPFKFLVVNTGEKEIRSVKVNLSVLNLPFPCETYRKEWWNKKYYNTLYGKDFEQKIAKFCSDNIKIYD